MQRGETVFVRLCGVDFLVLVIVKHQFAIGDRGCRCQVIDADDIGIVLSLFCHKSQRGVDDVSAGKAFPDIVRYMAGVVPFLPLVAGRVIVFAVIGVASSGVPVGRTVFGIRSLVGAGECRIGFLEFQSKTVYRSFFQFDHFGQVNGEIVPFLEVDVGMIFGQVYFFQEYRSGGSCQFAVVVVGIFLQKEIHVLLQHLYDFQVNGFQSHGRKGDEYLVFVRNDDAFADEFHFGLGGTEIDGCRVLGFQGYAGNAPDAGKNV